MTKKNKKRQPKTKVVVKLPKNQRRRKAQSNQPRNGNMTAFVPRAMISRRTGGVSKPMTFMRGGEQIVKISGSQVFCPIANQAGSGNILGTTTSSGNSWDVSPDAIGGTVGAFSDRFNKYKFTRLCFEYVCYVPNSTDGHGFAFGYNAEGAAGEFSVTFSSVTLSLIHI